MVKVRKHYFARFSIFYRIVLGALQNVLADGFDFQAGNLTCILKMKSFEDISFKNLLLQGKDLNNNRRQLRTKLDSLEQRNPCPKTDYIFSVVFPIKDN